MHIVINVPEKEYKRMKLLRTLSSDNECLRYILEGTPLPKGHGRLIDADDAKREWQNVLDCEVEHPRYQCTIRDALEDAPTIIDADTESEGKE